MAAIATGDAHQPLPCITDSCGGKHFTNLCAHCYASYIEKSNGVAREECDNCSYGTGKLFLPNQLHNIDNNSILCADCKAKHDNEEQDHFNDEEECPRCGKMRWSDNSSICCSGRANAAGVREWQNWLLAGAKSSNKTKQEYQNIYGVDVYSYRNNPLSGREYFFYTVQFDGSHSPNYVVSKETYNKNKIMY